MQFQVLIFVCLTMGVLQADPKSPAFFNTYRNLEIRFNGEIAGRYPFGDSGSREASPTRVRNFFKDYEGQFLTLREGLQNEFQADTGLGPALLFLGRLNQVEALLRPILLAPKGLQVTFSPWVSQDATQPSAWSIGDGFSQIPYIEGKDAIFNWTIGIPVVLETIWLNAPTKEGVTWRPDKRRHSNLMTMEIRGETARFVERGDWALLRFSEYHAFRVHLVGTGKDTLEQTVTLHAQFRVRQNHLPATPIAWPDSFPRFAPRLSSSLLLNR